jgi:hypothetical protein
MSFQNSEEILELVNFQPALLVRPISDKQQEKQYQAINLSRLDIDIQIFGFIAETKMTMTFENPHDRELAGDLYFPLPEGSTLSGYALDVNGVLVDGVVVEKKKGRQVFEKIVREGVDPGLAEWVKGNNFKTRIYPIPARGSRTVMVRYISELVSGNSGITYHLPLNYKQAVKKFLLRIEVIKVKSRPLVRKSNLANFEFGRWQDSFVANSELEDAVLAEDIVIAVPDVGRQNVMVEKDPDSDFYFCISDFPEIPKSETSPKPNNIIMLWDASGSRGKINHSREIELLKSYFKQFENQTVNVDLIFFRHTAEEPIHFEIKNGNSDLLINALLGVHYDGGTQMASISPREADELPDFYMLFTDGISNFGKEDPIGFKRPVYVICDSSSANHAFMRYIALCTEGNYFNLKRIEDASAIAGIGRKTFSFLSVSVEEGKIVDINPTTSQPVNDRFTLTGRLVGDSAALMLNYGVDGKIVHKVHYTISRSKAVEVNLLKRFWAQKKIEELQILPKRNEEQIIAIGKRHGIVTQGTSLIVLESLDQYLEYEIAPPETLPIIRKQYEESMQKRKQLDKDQENEKIDDIINLWQDRIAWWETEFDGQVSLKEEQEDSGLEISDDSDDIDQLLDSENELDLQCDMEVAGSSLNAVAFSISSEPMMEESMDFALLESDVSRNSFEDSGITDSCSEPTISIKSWDPDTPYLKSLKTSSAAKQFTVYMDQRGEYGNSPAFYLDCADFFFNEKKDELAVQILSNIAELELENASLLRILAHRLSQIGMLEESITLFEGVLKMRSEEPQSYRDLALAISRRAEGLQKDNSNTEKCCNDFQRAIELLYQIVVKRWDRFEEIEIIALMELNREIHQTLRR